MNENGSALGVKPKMGAIHWQGFATPRWGIFVISRSDVVYFSAARVETPLKGTIPCGRFFRSAEKYLTPNRNLIRHHSLNL
ncbi:hypothetical protein VXQ18_12270 [Brucella abortus]|nr:hypothetical protein [Brucella abortus]